MSGGPVRFPTPAEMLLSAAEHYRPDEVVRRLKKRVKELYAAGQDMNWEEASRWRKLVEGGKRVNDEYLPHD